MTTTINRTTPMLSKLKLPVFLLFIFIQTSASAQTTMPKKYQSLLWEISGNGLKKNSYLYGTMHVSDKLVFNLPDSFFVAIKNVDIVALELNMDKWMDDIMQMEEARNIQNKSQDNNNQNGFYRRAFPVDAPKEYDLKSLLQFSPNISNSLMYRNNKQNSDYEEDNFLDVFIFQAGKKLNKKIIGLENFKQTEEFSIKSEKPDDTDDDDEKNKDEREQKRLKLKELRGDKSYYDIQEDAYRKGNLDLLDSLNNLSRTKAFLENMLYARNLIMAKRMDSIMQKSPLFTGVGAAHLPGTKGVIELLKQMGYSVRPILTSQSDIKSKKIIDETRFPTVFKTHYPNDSAFSVALPGNLFEFGIDGSYRYYLHNDLSNGAYYCIQRMNHYGKFMDETPEELLKRLDSLIFENIPGKLLSKKDIKSSNGYPGIEIVNKTSKGDVQKHQIFATPTELYSFKMSGTQEYVQKGTETDAFFSSINFRNAKSESSIYKSKLGYSVSLPNKRNSFFNSTSYKNQNEIITASDNNAHYLVMCASLYDFEYIEEDTFELNMLAERFCLETHKKLVSKNFTTKNGAPSLWFKMEEKNKAEVTYIGQIIINGPSYYLLCTNTDSTAAIPFLNSFTSHSKTYTIPFKETQDTTGFFSVSTQELKNNYSPLIELRKNNPYELSTKKEKESKEKKQFLPVKETIIYTSPETAEKVSVEYRKFSMYFQQETMEEFWKSRINAIGESQYMKASRIKNTKKENGTTEVELLLTDTNSTRGIVVKLIQRCGTLYTIKTVVDTTKGMDLYAKTFFETFKPKDTCIGADITKNKLDEYFFNKIYSKDTIESKRAKEAIEYVQANVLASNIPSLIKTINDKEFIHLATEDKKDLIACFNTVKSKETLPFLEGLYIKYADSVEIELAILKTVARLKSINASKLFLKLLKYDVPISANEYPISYVFAALADSLQTAAVLFPELIKYTKYVEYKNSIYKLMTQVNEANFLKPKVYSKIVDDILLDANYELKKYISDKDRDKEGYRYSSYSKTDQLIDDLNTRQQKMYYYTQLLAPFYKSADVNKFFSKTLSSTTSDKFRAIIYGQLLTNKVAIQDTILKKYAASVSSRYTFYRILKKNNQLEHFDKTYLNQKDLVVSQLFGSSETFKKDTLIALPIYKVSNGNKEGNAYVFKTKQKDKKTWKLSYSSVHPQDLAQINYKPKYSKTYISFEGDRQAQKEIDTLLRKIRVDTRDRASVKDFELETANDYSYLDF